MTYQTPNIRLPAVEELSQASRPRPSAGLALSSLAAGGFAIGTTEFASMSLLPQISTGFDISEPIAGHLISAYAIGVVIGAPIIAVLGARLPRRDLLIGLMVFFAVANLASALAPGFSWLLVFRFLSGVPHGAFFGVGALVAASLVPSERRTQAVGRMMLGLTAATIAGVPLANIVGQWAGWRWGFVIVTALAGLTAVLILLFVPWAAPEANIRPLRELRALKRVQVWLTLGIGAIGFGGIFAVYTYLASTLTQVTGAPASMVPVALAVFGVGMTLGTVVCAWGADRALMPTAGLTLLFTAIALAFYASAATQLWTMLLINLLIGGGVGLGSVLQTRLMDVAGEGQTLAAALNHSAFNTANAIGPLLGGLAIEAGYGWTSTGYVGVALCIGGIAVWAASYLLQSKRRT